MYQCPDCGGGLKFDIASQDLKCTYCEKLFSPYSITKDSDAEESEEYDATIFTCPQCGGRIVSDDTTAAAFCSFCGASTILDSRVSKTKKPSYVIPFKKNKDDCKKAYRRMMRRAIFAPSALKSEANIDNFRAIYMPYWRYIYGENSDISFKGTTTHRSGDYRITRHYSMKSHVESLYDAVEFDAASSFADDISNSVMPFNRMDMKYFTPSYLCGFYADTSDVGQKTYKEDARKIVIEDCARRMMSDAQCRKYNAEESIKKALNPECTRTELALFPVWFMSCRNKDRIAYAVVNGQTGKVAANLPADTTKYIIGSLILAIPIYIVLNVLFTIKPAPLLIFALILLAICFIFSMSQTAILSREESGANDKGYMHGRKRSKKKDKSKALIIKPPYIATGVVCIIDILILVINFVSDLYYYAGAFIALIAVIWLLIDILQIYNRLVTKELPQFARTGGDDRA